MKPSARHLIAFAATMLLLAACGSESEPSAQAKPTPSPSSTLRADVDVLDPVLVMNDDGSATLSARIVNHTDQPREIGDVTPSDLDDPPGTIRRFSIPAHSMIEPGDTASTGNIGDPVRIRITRDVAPGKVVPLHLWFYPADMTSGDIMVPLTVSVVERTPRYDSVAGNKPNTAITVENARITVIPGQGKAYVNGIVVSTIDDAAWELPTAVDADGKPVAYQHQTATGGPYGIEAQKGKKLEIGSGPPYSEEGDADYFNAKDVTVGETITVTIPFQSGDVIVPFKVVAG